MIMENVEVKMPRIIFVGQVCIDHNTVEHATYVSWGSPALYMAKYLQMAYGITPTILAKHGADFVGYTGNILLCPREPSSDPTLIYENIVKDGRRIQRCRNHLAAAPVPITREVKSLLAKADIIFLAPLTPTYTSQYVAELMDNTPEKCLKVLLPQGYLRKINEDSLVQLRNFDEASNILPFFDLAILSDEDHPHAVTKAHEWRKTSPNTEIIVTQNAGGASIVQEDRVTHIPTTPIPNKQIVDSVGCGDVFGAATAYHLFATDDLALAVRKGHEAARKKLLTPKAAYNTPNIQADFA